MTPADMHVPSDPRSDAAAARWMKGRGLGVLLDDTRFGVRATVRALPVLAVLFLAVMVLELPLLGWRRGVCAAVGVGCVLALWGLAVLRRRRPRADGRRRAGWLEFATFVAAPPLVAYFTSPRDLDVMREMGIREQDLRWFGATTMLSQQTVLLTIVLLLLHFDIVALSRWLMRELTQSVSSASTALSRVVPILMVALLLSYYTAELWQSIGKMSSLPYFAVIMLFLLLGGVFLARREHFDVDAVARFDTHEQLAAALADTPHPEGAAGVTLPAKCPLSARQERALLMVASGSRLVLASLIGSFVVLFFLILGWLTVDAASVKSWSGGAAHKIISFDGAGHTYLLSWEHVRVAGFLAAFSGFYYAVSSATDANMRQGLRDTATDSLRSACALRLMLLEKTHPASCEADMETDPPPTAA